MIDWKAIKKAADIAPEEVRPSNSYRGHFDATPVTPDNPLRPRQVFDPALPNPVDRRYTGKLGKLRRTLSRGPGTTTYDASRYSANEPGDYVIVFGGAGTGTGGTSPDSMDPDRSYGKGNYATFTWRQIPEAMSFAESLPKGSRLHIYGHSMGGTAALRFAEEARKKGIQIAGMDLRDAVRIDGRLKALAGKIINKTDYPDVPSNVSRATHLYNGGWFNNINPFGKRFTPTDFVSLVGQRWNGVRGASNIQTPAGMDHKQIGTAYNPDYPVANGWRRDSGRSSLWRATHPKKQETYGVER